MNFDAEIKPFLRQCLVTAGVSLCIMEHSLVVSFTGVLVPQLRNETYLDINQNVESWIASIHGTSIFLGALITPFIMYRYGRRKANLINAIIMIVGWLCVMLAPGTNMILFGRFIQGIALGISSLSSAMLVGEYTSPKYRGAFLTAMTLTISIGNLIIHTLGSFLPWRTTAMICLGITIVDLIVIIISPESPVFLAARGRYDECRQVFHWLRGTNENQELEVMIKDRILNRNVRCHEKAKSIINKISSIIICVKDPVFFKPLFVMLHVDVINIWSGGIMMNVYATDIYHKIVGSQVNIAALMIIVDSVRIIASFCAVFIHTKFKRRSMLILFITLNIIIYFLIAAKSYFIDKQGKTSNYPTVGTGLVIFHMFIAGAGAQPLTNTIAGEILPLRYKGIHSMMSTIFISINVTVKMKTLPYLFACVELSGAYCIYGGIIAYAMIVAVSMMPETNGKSLFNIEKSWKKISEESCLTKPLSTWNQVD